MSDRDDLIHQARCWLADAGLPADDIPDEMFTYEGFRVQVPAWFVSLRGIERPTAEPGIVTHVWLSGAEVRVLFTHHSGIGFEPLSLADVRPRCECLPTDPTDAPRIVG